jgi:predicted DNA-binding transcriptional regulator AlpA
LLKWRTGSAAGVPQRRLADNPPALHVIDTNDTFNIGGRIHPPFHWELTYPIPLDCRRVFVTWAAILDDRDSLRMSLSNRGREHTNMHQVPETGFLRLAQIIGNRNVSPPIPAIVPISKSSWWAGVKTGRFPKPVKLGPRMTVWRVEDIRALVEKAV